MSLSRAIAFSPSKIRWRLHRMLVDMWHWYRPFTRSATRRLLLISCEGRISQSQVYPIFHFRREIEDAFGVQLREISLQAFEAGAPTWDPEADIVLVQPWFDISEERLRNLLESVHERCSPSRVVFFDSFAPTDLRLGNCVDPYVDLYVKKHVLRDRSLYGRPTRGDTNLMEYYGSRFGFEFPVVHYPVSNALLGKLLVGPSFATADFMLGAFQSGSSPSAAPKEIDLHARIETEGSDWYAAMRGEAQAAVERIEHLHCVTGVGVRHAEYLQELANSKVCLSPFGYGEVAWRDYEAVLCKALLFKPDCSHIEVDPDIFVPYETYIPLEWDFSDLLPKLEHYLCNPDECERITNNAFERLHQYYSEHEYLTQLRLVFE